MRMLGSRTRVTHQEWEDLAHFDPFFAILSENEKKFGKWDPQEFFSRGQSEIDTLMASCGLVRGNNGRVLDFGCGVGRLSRALGCYFGEVYGVDISEEMIRMARQYAASCTFLVNQNDDLKLFQSDFFDFIYCNIVLQHQRTQTIAKSYIREFVRVLKPRGTVVFQMPYKLTFRGALQIRRRLYSLLKSLGFSGGFLYKKCNLTPMRGISLASAEVRATVLAAGGRLVRSYHDDFNYYSMGYVVTKM